MHAAPASVDPRDAHDRELLSRVRPPHWSDPTPSGRYDLVVLGGGSGGLVSAAIASALGARVALVESGLLGGDCLNVGCVPSKSLLEAARGWHAANTAAGRFGGPVASCESARFAAAMERMRRTRAEIGAHDAAERFRSELGVDVFLSKGRFAGEDSVVAGGQTLRFRRAIVATGARAAVPAIPGLAEAGHLTNTSIFGLAELPERLGIIGGGPVGCEMAQAFARFGSQVTVLEMEERILPQDDAEAAEVVLASLRRDGVDFHAGVTVEEVSRQGEVRSIRFTAGRESRTLQVDQLLVAAGRLPNVEGLGLEAAGVEYDPSTGVQVNDRLQTTNGRIFAVGDVVPGAGFTHRSDHHARIAVPNALFFGRGTPREHLIPWCTYTSPELAHVGITARAAQEEQERVDTLTVAFREVDRARLAGSDDGFLRIHLRRGKDTILGATIVGDGAGETIAPIAAAMTAGVGLAKLGETIFPYPTRAEIIRAAADSHRRRKLTPRASRALRLFWKLRP